MSYVDPRLWDEVPGLYRAARDACFSVGIPWTDSRTGIIHRPPKLRRKRKVSKRREHAK